MPYARDDERVARQRHRRQRGDLEMIPTGSRGEPLAQDGEREVRRRRRGKVCGPLAQDVEREASRRRRGKVCEPLAHDGEREVRRRRREVCGPLAQDVEREASRKRLCVERPQIESAASEEESSDVEDFSEEMADRFMRIMSRHAADEQVQRESGNSCNLTVETEFCDVDDGSFQSCEARKVAVLASKSVVSLSSFSDGKRIRVCSGFVIGSDPCTNIRKILTSATLVRSISTRNILIPDLKVKVGLLNGHIYEGFISMIDFHYNIAVVEVKTDQKLPDAVLVSDVVKRGTVLAIGRFYDHGGVMCAQGEIIKQASTFECSELLVSTCRTTMAGVGGPLVNYTGHVVGVNFYGENHTPFLSTALIIRCLDHWKSYGKIIRPWLGLSYTPVDMLPLRVLEKCTHVEKGFYISKVAKGSPADVAGLCTGDVLIECAGKVPSTAPELGALLLDFCKEQMESYTLESNVTVEVVVRKQRDGREVRKTVSASVLSECGYYSWYDPSPSYSDNKMGAMQIFKS